MSGYIVWMRGLRGPELQKHEVRPRPDSAHYREYMIGQPLPMKDGDWEKSIDELRKIYPTPVLGGET
jgi:hypothetical protein